MRAIDSGRWRQPRSSSCGSTRATTWIGYAEFEGLPHVIIEKPFRTTVKAGDGLAVDITPENQQHLADTMRHSDVVVNVASTIAIEAAIFDTPVVNVSFDGETPSEFVRSARRYYRFTHYVNITRHDAARVAEHAGAAGRARRPLPAGPIARSRRPPAGRARAVSVLDGRSAERVAGFVVEELADVCGWTKDVARSAAS